jgi:translocation and assembly module TamB
MADEGTQVAVAEGEEERRSRTQLIVALLSLAVVLILAAVWTQRLGIAARFIDNELERRNVQATYKIARLGLRTEIMEDLVIGDPRRPDATAKRVLIKIGLRWGYPKVTQIRAEGVRIFGRVVDGKVSLGSIDRLLPPPTGEPFRLPDLDVELKDTALALDSSYGRAALAIEGKGNLADGFRGELAALSRRMLVEQCAIERPRAYFKLAINDRRPTVDGPLRADRIVCGQTATVDALLLDLESTFSQDWGDWIGRSGIAAAGVNVGGNQVRGLRGRFSFNGDDRLTRGNLDLAAAAGLLGGIEMARPDVAGRYAFGGDGTQLSFLGEGGAAGMVVPRGVLAPALAALEGVDGTPLEPIARALAANVIRAGNALSARADFRLVNGPSFGAVRVERFGARSRSGAQLGLTGGEGLTYYWPIGVIRTDGEFALAGGGFPATRLSLNQPRGGAPVSGTARIAPMAAGGARLALGEVRFGPGGGGSTQVDTIVNLSGPLSAGRIDGLVLPVSGRIGGAGGFAFGERCTVASFRFLRVSSLTLGPTRLPLCPTGRALLWKGPGGALQGGAELRGPRLAGRLGQSPVSLLSDRLRVTFAGFSGSNVAIRLGGGEYVHRLDFGTLAGRFNARGVAGTFAGASAKIANVPLLLSNASGRWSVAGGNAVVDGSLTVADDAAQPRFYPLVSNDFHLTMINNNIEATAWLQDPETGTRITQVSIEHALSNNRGHALLDVPGIEFSPEYQPEELTRLTTGVIAIVRGILRGQGRIAWGGPGGTTSSGTFGTEDMDLAAPFGPITGLRTTMHFTDLLGLTTAPGQTAFVEQIQAGIDVFNGQIRYQLLPNQRVRIEAARWPFAGGELLLEDTMLDFSQPSTKRLTFRVVGLDAAAFIQQMEFSNISATGTFDGVIPMEFTQAGGRIIGGRLVARPEGGTLSYIGEVSDASLGAYGKLAFDALKSLRYSKFNIGLNGSLEGEFVADIELDGLARNTAGPGGIVGMVLAQIAKIPFEFNIAIRGPFRALIGTARSFEDPSILIQPVLPEQLRDLPVEVIDTDRNERETVQPQESEIVQ